MDEGDVIHEGGQQIGGESDEFAVVSSPVEAPLPAVSSGEDEQTVAHLDTGRVSVRRRWGMWIAIARNARLTGM